MRKPTPKPANTSSKPKLVVKSTPSTTPRKTPPVLVAAPAPVAKGDAGSAPVAAVTDAGSVVQTKFKDLVERVAAASGQKPKDVRDVVAATLAELGKAIELGEALNLPPLGKIKLVRSRDLAVGASLTLKLRRGGAAGEAGNTDRKAAKTALVEHDKHS